MDKLLVILPIIGCAFKKSFYDATEARNSSLLVYPKNLVVNYWAKSLETAPRLTEYVDLYPYEIEEMKRAGLFLDEDYGPGDDTGVDPDAPHRFYEQHRRIDLDGDGYPEPYIVTVHEASQKLARVVARFDPEGVLFSRATNEITKVIPVHYYTKFDFLPNPDGGIYGVGFGQLLNPINESVNTTLNMMFDAGNLQNTGGGFLGKGLSMHSGAVKFRLGEWKIVNAPGRTIKDSVVPFNHQGPSPVLFQLLGFLVEAGRDVARIKDVLTGDQAASQVPATTILALIEQGLKVFSAIFKRIHNALKSEYNKLYRLNRLFLEESATYRVGQETKQITRADYEKGSGVEPVSDPRTVSNMQRLGRAELLRMFLTDPFTNPIEVRRRIFESAEIEDIEELLKPDGPPNPEIVARMREVAIREVVGRADALNKMSAAVLNLAKADATDGAARLEWVRAQFDMLQQEMEQMVNGALPGEPAAPGAPGGAPGAGPPGDQRNNGAALPAVGPQPGNGGLPAVPPGLQ